MIDARAPGFPASSRPGTAGRTDPAQRDDALTAHFGYRLAPTFVRAQQSDTQLLETLRSQAIVPETIDATSLLIVRSTISTGQPDSYQTIMDETTLRNYAAEAAAGVSVLYGHDTWAIIGRSFSGVYVPRGDGRCESECYIPAGLTLGGIQTDDVVRAIGLGMLREVSVGFTGGEMRCTLCDRSIWDFECPHIPGVAYQVDGKRKPQTAFVRIVDAHLAEYSLVYAGSTPDASVLGAKALREADAGRLPPETARALETSYRVRLPGSHRAWPTATREPERAPPGEQDEQPADDDAGDADGVPPSEGSPDQADDDEPTTAPTPDGDAGDEEEPVTKPTTPPASPPAGGTPETPSVEERVRAVLSTVIDGEIGDVATALAGVTTELTALRPAAAELETARARIAADAPLVGYGKQWLEREVQHALTEGQRALGEKFDRAKWEPVLRAMEPEAVRLMADGWTGQGDALFKPGRQTTDAGRAPANAPPISPAVAAGFRA